MVRISDLVRGKTSTPGSVGKDRPDSMRLSNLEEFIHFNVKTPREIPAELRQEKPPEQRQEKPLEQRREEPPEQHPEQRQGKLPEQRQEKHPEQRQEEPPEQRRGESPVQQLLPIPGNLANPDAQQIYLYAQNYVREVRDRLIAGQPLPLEKPLGIIERMIADPPLVDALYQLTLKVVHNGDPNIASSVNSMIYCFKIGVRMDYTHQNLVEICLAALHHDIGMFLIPGTIVKKTGKLDASELAILRNHTEVARDLTKPYDATYPNVSRAIYEHHERENGKGYPRGLKGNEISEYAQIIGICDSYEAMTHDRPHKKAAAQYVSVLQLAVAKDQLFAPHIMKVFLDEITLYPIGSHVRLNNKAIGVVVQTNHNNPFKPTVRIVTDGQGSRVSSETLINLADDNILNIVAGVAADEVP
jgi:hypothetical protein